MQNRFEEKTLNGWTARLGLGLLLAFLLISGCTTKAPAVADTPGEKQSLRVSGFTIPVFDSAATQLNYAKSLFANPREKSVALKLILSRFPHDRQQQGEARLELAYLQLGPDFRLAGSDACANALAAYEAIAREFTDLPAVRAKAGWYMGWIYTDLLKDKTKGLALYSLLAEKYPQDRFSRISPVPWLKLIFPNPEIKPYTADDEHTHSWAGLALLEIVRHADDASMRMQAFDTLWREHRNSMTTGYALKTILSSAPASPRMAGVVDEYVRSNTINPELNKDLCARLARWSPRERQTEP